MSKKLGLLNYFGSIRIFPEVRKCWKKFINCQGVFYYIIRKLRGFSGLPSHYLCFILALLFQKSSLKFFRTPSWKLWCEKQDLLWLLPFVKVWCEIDFCYFLYWMTPRVKWLPQKSWIRLALPYTTIIFIVDFIVSWSHKKLVVLLLLPAGSSNEDLSGCQHVRETTLATWREENLCANHVGNN